MRLAPFLFWLATLTGMLGGCVSIGAGGAGRHAHVLRIAYTDTDTLNPLLAHDQATIGYDLLFCQTLVGLDAHNRLVPVLLTRLPSRANGDISADGRRIVYHLRRGVRFADGTVLSAADVAFTYRAIIDPRNPVLSADAYHRIGSLETPDRYTVVIRLKHRWNAAVSDLFAQSDFAFGILPAHAFKGTQMRNTAWEEHAFGTGPFRVVEWRRGDRIVLEPNPYFSPRPKLSRIELRIIPDDNSAVVALETGEVDVATVSPSRIEALRGRPLRILRTPENNTFWLTLQMRSPPTDALAVRKAIAYALDVRTIGKVFHGLYAPAASFLPPVLTPWYEASIRPFPYDPAIARRLLGRRSIEALLVQEPGPVAPVVQSLLERAGMHVIVKPCSYELCNSIEGPLRNGKFTMTIFGWTGGADPEQSIVFLCAQANLDGDNLGRYCEPRFERLFADQQTTDDAAQRIRDFRAMQRLIHDEVAVIPLFYAAYFEGMSPRVSGLQRNMLTYPVSPENWDIR